MIKVNNINKYYNDFQALNNINLEISKGDFVCIYGNSGSGKTTLLNILGLIDNKFEGEYILNDVSIKSLNDNQLAELRNKYFGYIFQSYNVDPYYSVYESIEIPLIISKKKDYKDKILDIISYVGLGEKTYKKCSTLSGGELQRVSVARALVNDAEIIIADEPTGALDSKNANNIMALLKDLNEKGKTIILVTHNAEQIKLANKVFNISDGELINETI